MATKIRSKEYQEDDVYTAAKKRINHLYDLFEELVVSFSGGKDSTAMLLTTIEVARERGQLPVRAVFYDEEAIHPPTIDYVRRVSLMDEVELEWYCLPIQHRNACSNKQPYWHPWHPDEEDIWVRELPPEAITEHPRFEPGMSMQEFGLAHFSQTNICVLQGIRTQESMRRHRAVSQKKEDNYISTGKLQLFKGYKEDGVTQDNNWVASNFAYPIYDWSSEDVWQLVRMKGADYNTTYDIFNRTDKYNQLLSQRVCPPFGEEPLRGLHLYKECFPEMWDKMINRVPGARTAAMYANTELYTTATAPPEGITWRQHVENILQTFTGKDRAAVEANINREIKHHQKLTDHAIPQDEPHVVSGLSWRFIAKMAIRGDLKGRIAGERHSQAYKAQQAMGITEQEALEKYGKPQT